MSLPEEYSVAIWVTRDGQSVQVFEVCYGHNAVVDSKKEAAQKALVKALLLRRVDPGEECEVDVSEDASDRWETVLTGAASCQ